MIQLQYKKLRAAALALLAVPAILFFAGWLKPLIALPCIALLSLAVFFAAKSGEQKTINIKPSTLIALFVLVLLWAFLSGQGGFFTQKTDWEYRNVIFRDLINYPWPVRYGGEHDESLVYYIGYWLLPALCGKIGLKLGGFAAGWLAARIVSLLWTAVLIYVSFLIVLFRVGKGRKKAVYLTLAVFVLFSGMDAIMSCTAPQKFLSHIEWWASYFQYSSMSTQLCWVFNQAVPAWLACALAFNEKDEKAFALIGLLLLPSSPLPLIGLAVYMLAFAARSLVLAVKAKAVGGFFKNIFTVQNILAVLTLLPVYALYYGNNAVTTDSATGGAGSAAEYDVMYFVVYLIFILMEFLALLLMLRKKENRFETAVIFMSLAVIPFIRVGTSIDFCMRASIPSLFLLMLLLSDYLVPELLTLRKEKNKSKDYQNRLVKLFAVLLVVAIGAVTPAVEYTSSARKFIQTKGACVTEYDYMDTLATLPLESKMNFVGTQSADSAFYRYVAKDQ